MDSPKKTQQAVLTTPQKFVKKADIFEAIAFTGLESYIIIQKWMEECQCTFAHETEYRTPIMLFPSESGHVAVQPGQYVCRDANNRFYSLSKEAVQELSLSINFQAVDFPKNLQQAVQYLLPRFRGMETEIKQHDEAYFASFCHSQISGGIGMKIRNELQLWVHDSPLHQWFLTHMDLHDADAMSDAIVREIYRFKRKGMGL